MSCTQNVVFDVQKKRTIFTKFGGGEVTSAMPESKRSFSIMTDMSVLIHIKSAIGF